MPINQSGQLRRSTAPATLAFSQHRMAMKYTFIGIACSTTTSRSLPSDLASPLLKRLASRDRKPVPLGFLANTACDKRNRVSENISDRALSRAISSQRQQRSSRVLPALFVPGFFNLRNFGIIQADIVVKFTQMIYRD